MAKTRFDRIVAKLLRDPDYRVEVCADAKNTIGPKKFASLSDTQQGVIKRIACDNLTTTELEAELAKVQRSYEYYVTDW